MHRMLSAGLTAAFFAAVLLGPAQAAPAPAASTGQKAPPAAILLVDGQDILRDSLAAKDIRRQIDSFRTRFQNEITKQEEQLKKERDELQRQRAVLSPEAFSDKRRAFEEKVANMQRGIQERSQRIEQALGGALETLKRSLAPIFADIMKERSANLLLDENQILAGASDMDVTKEAIRRLDQVLPRVSVQLPPAGSAAAGAAGGGAVGGPAD